MYTTHGHHIPGTVSDGPKKKRTRCGGLRACKKCRSESMFYRSGSQKDLKVEFSPFVRKPFAVEAVEITRDNIYALSKLIGKVEINERGEEFILVDKNLVPNVSRVFLGYWVTKMGDNIRCYAPKIFAEQFAATTPTLQALVQQIENPTPPMETAHG